MDGDFTDAGDKHWYHLTDPQFSTVAILDSTATVVEEVTYDAFGRARHHQYKDLDGDGDFDATDRGIITTISGGAGNLIGQANYRSEADLDRDGDVDSTDLTLCGTNYQSAIASGYLSDRWNNSGTDNTHGWSGYHLDRETRLYHVRFRYYDTSLMRWINRDPAGYADAMNLYGLGAGSPIGFLDPFGLAGPSFASGVYIDRDGFIGFDPSQFGSRSLAWWMTRSWDNLRAGLGGGWVGFEISIGKSVASPFLAWYYFLTGNDTALLELYWWTPLGQAEELGGWYPTLTKWALAVSVVSAGGAAIVGIWEFFLLGNGSITIGWRGGELIFRSPVLKQLGAETPTFLRINPLGNWSAKCWYEKIPHWHFRLPWKWPPLPGGGIGRHLPWEWFV